MNEREVQRILGNKFEDATEPALSNVALPHGLLVTLDDYIAELLHELLKAPFRPFSDHSPLAWRESDRSLALYGGFQCFVPLPDIFCFLGRYGQGSRA